MLGKDPKNNKYITMFYMWFTYLKRYAGLGPDDCIGVIVDEDTLDYINSESTFGYLNTNVPFNVELSVMKRPANLSEGFAERYRAENFEQFTTHTLNLHIDIDCLCIRSIKSLFNEIDLSTPSFFSMAEPGYMCDDNHGGNLIKKEDLPHEEFPGLSAGWYAWMHSDDQKILFESVLKGCLANADKPFYTVDQPFYNYELLQIISEKKKVDFKVCVMDYKLVAFNPLISDSSLALAHFVNFCGEPGVEECHFNKIFAFMLMDFSMSVSSVPCVPCVPCVSSTSTSANTEKQMDIRDENELYVDINRYEKQEQCLVRKYIEYNDSVLELGARYGSVSCIINSKLKSKTNQVVVEPDSRVWDALEGNKLRNGCEFNIVKGFISAKKLSLTDLNYVDGYGTRSIEDNESNISSFTLDEIKAKYNIDFNVLVVDCEGFLETFLDENPTIYDKLRLIIFEADCPDKCDYAKIKSILHSKGFICMLNGFQNVWTKDVVDLTPASIPPPAEPQEEQEPPQPQMAHGRPGGT